MIRLHDDTVDRILEGDKEGDVVLHATPPNLYYGSGPPAYQVH